MTRYVTDLRLAARGLARAPLFSLIAIASIALGIGASTAVFTLLDQVALRGAAGGAARRAGPAVVEGHRILRRRPGQRHRAVVADVSATFAIALPGVDGAVRPGRGSRSTSGTPAAPSASRASWSRATTSPSSGVTPATGRLLTARRRPAGERRPAARRARLRLLAAALLRQRRRRSARPSSSTAIRCTVVGVAAARLLRPRAADAGRRVRAADDAAADRSAVAEARGPPLSLGAGLRPPRRRHDGRARCAPASHPLYATAARGARRPTRPSTRASTGDAARLPGGAPRRSIPAPQGQAHPARVSSISRCGC